MKRLRKSAAYRAVAGVPRWARLLGMGLMVVLAEHLHGKGLGDWPTVVLILAGLWLVAPDLDDAIAGVLKAWKGGADE